MAQVAGRRSLAAWIPDWPVVAAMRSEGIAADVALVVMSAGVVSAASASARGSGVRSGMRKRAVQEICPDVQLLPADPLRDARMFEDVATCVEEDIPDIELMRPGLLVAPSRGAARYFGGEEALLKRVVERVAERSGMEVFAGIADSVLAAILASRTYAIIPAGGGEGYLSQRSLEEVRRAFVGTPYALELEQLIDLLVRLGVHTLGQFGNLRPGDVNARFGGLGMWLWRLTHAQDVISARFHRPEREYSSEISPHDPIANIDQAAFAARWLAEDLFDQLAARGHGFSLLEVRARTEGGEELSRLWRIDEIDASGVAERVRWQLEGWIGGRSGQGPSSGLISLTLVAQDVHPAGEQARSLWGRSGQRQRAMRGAERIHTMLGNAKVVLPVLQGGRDPQSRIRLVAFGDEAVPARPQDAPWPGRIPDPAPATVLHEPLRAVLMSDSGMSLNVTDTGEMAGTPAVLSVGNDFYRVTHWAGPWPLRERWWEEGSGIRAYIQLVLSEEVPKGGYPEDPRRRKSGDLRLAEAAGALAGMAVLLCQRDSNWSVEGIYD